MKSPLLRIIISTLLVTAISPIILQGQSHRRWTRSFNEESSLLSGAVVGGGVGPSAIYYNPAAIADVGNSSLSLHASLFSVDFFTASDAMGDGIDLHSVRGIIQPRFISYLIQPRRNPDFSIEFAYLNNEQHHLELSGSVDERIDLLASFEGDERYFANFNYKNSYRDDWVGTGVSWRLSKGLFAGGSMFAQFKTGNYEEELAIEAYPTTMQPDQTFYSAAFQHALDYHFNDYRLVWKIAMLMKRERFTLGVTVTTPSLHVYSDGKRILHKQKQSDIHAPAGEPVPDYVIVSYQEKSAVEANLKDPWSVAAGVTWYLDDRKTLFATCEYFHGLDIYKMIYSGEEDPDIAGSGAETVDIADWLTILNGATPVFNAAAGYRWEVHENLLVMGGFRTDFNYMKRLGCDDCKTNKTGNLDVYHVTGGVRWTVLGQDLITGVQYSVGHDKEIPQIADLSDPVEYDPATGRVLQGAVQPVMELWYNSLSFYFGATFNFGQGKEEGAPMVP